MSIGILGGGLSGISLQYFLKQDSEVLEAQEKIGGLCRTFEKEGFYYDIGGHILYSKSAGWTELVQRLLGTNCRQGRRVNRVLYKGRSIKYPFENGLSGLPKKEAFECLMGYLLNSNPKPSNFRQWIYHTFGKGIAEKYLIPYNEKIWKYPLDHMGLEWVERIPKPPVADVIKSALGIETEGYRQQLNFLYPRRGGIASFAESFIKDPSKVVTSYKITQIKKASGGWSVSDGKTEKRFDRLVSTLPPHGMIRLLENVPQKVKDSVAALRYNSLRVVLIGLNNVSLDSKSAVYIPDAGVLPHRLCFMRYFSDQTVPEGKSSLIAEISMPPESELSEMSDASLIEKTIADLSQKGVFDRKDVAVTDCRNIEYAYIVYDLDYGKHLGVVGDYFASLGIELLGRFGRFEYINMDEAVLKSRSLAQRMEGPLSS